MTLTNHQHTLWIKLPLWVTSTLTDIWAEVATVRSTTNVDLLAVPLSCYGSSSGRKIYNALRATKRRLFESDPSIIDAIDNGIAWARGIHCGHPLPSIDLNYETAKMLMQTDNSLLRNITIFRRIHNDTSLIELVEAHLVAKGLPPTPYLKNIIDALAASIQYINTRN